jgi:hypothetical protein
MIFHPAIQFEDLFLFFWLAVIQPALAIGFGKALGDLQPWDMGSQPNLLLGLIFGLASLGAIGVLVTRSPGETDPDRSGGVTSFAHLPMIVSLGLFSLFAFDSLGVQNWQVLPCSLFAFFIAVGMLWSRLPVVPYIVRRVMITPMVILGVWMFTGVSDAVFRGVNLQLLLNPPDIPGVGDARGAVMNYLGLTTLFVLVYYLAFILSPRAIAGGGTSWRGWVIRFGIYLLGVLLNGATRIF